MKKIRPSKLPLNLTRRARLPVALAVSVLIHLSLAWGLTFRRPEIPAAPLEVSLLPVTPPPPKPKQEQETKKPQQIAPPSEATPSIPENPRFLSDRDTAAERESIRRGLPDAGSVQVQPVPPPRRPPPPEKSQSAMKEQRAVQHSSEAKLRLHDEGLAGRLASARPGEKRDPKQDAPQKPEPADSERLDKMDDYQPFQRRAPGSTLITGKTGVPDLLPSIPDGDITLLNAKADHHAVFVRRVALQVFGALRQLNWAQLSLGELRRARDFATVHAVMSKNGKLVSVSVESSSGTSVFDRILQQAAQRGTWDQNPPPNASAGDGNIHFVFKAKTWARPGGDGYREARWLLLGAGLL